MEKKNCLINRLQVIYQDFPIFIEVRDIRSIGYYLNTGVRFYFVLV